MALRIGDRVKVTKAGSASFGKTGTVTSTIGADGKFEVALDPVTIRALESSLSPVVPPVEPDPPRDPEPVTPRPYSADSAWNRKLVNPVVHPHSDAIVTNMLATGVGNLSADASPTKEYGHPVYHSKPGDKTYRIVTAPSNDLHGKTVAVDARAMAAGGGDGHMGIVDGMWEWCFWQVRLVGDELRCTNAYRQRANGTGVVTPEIVKAEAALGNRGIGGTTAPYYGLRAGIVTAAEMKAGVIPHMAFVVVAYGARDTSFGFGTRAPGANGRGGAGASVGDAFKGDRVDPAGRAWPPMGATFWLQATEAEIASDPCAPWEKTFLRMMRDYGGRMGDTGGPGFGFQLEPGVQYTSLGQPNPMVDVARSAGLKKDPTWGYPFVFTSKLWRARLRVLVP